MRLLFVHQNCPGQFKHLAPAMAASPNNEVVFITQPKKPDVPGVRKVEYQPHREVAESTHRYLRLTEQGVLNGQAVAKAAIELKKEGFFPDVIVAHMGWGEALYLKAVYPESRLIGYFEWFYHTRNSDVDFDPESPPTLDDICRLQTRNALHLMNLQAADWGLSPTRWQLKQQPREYQARIEIIHDGIDTGKVSPDPDAEYLIPNGRRFRCGDEVVTYISRNLEPQRGFPTFMRAAEIILKRRPHAHILVLGGDDVSYSRKCPGGKTYREHYLEQVDIDLERIHFLGKVPYHDYLQVLRVSGAHIYLTVPFVLSWSMLEAMSAGCAIVASKTPPVEEVIRDRKNGLLVDFFSAESVADGVDRILDASDRMQGMRDAARHVVVRKYDLNLCLKRQIQLINRIAARPKAAQRA